MGSVADPMTIPETTLFNAVLGGFDGLPRLFWNMRQGTHLIGPSFKDSFAEEIAAYTPQCGLSVAAGLSISDYDGKPEDANAVYEINKMQNADNKIPTEKIDLTDFYKEIRKSLSNILVDIDKTLGNKNIDDIFDDNEYRLLYLLDYMQRKVYWYSYIKAGALMGKRKAYIVFNSEKDKDKHDRIIELDNFSFEDIPSYHSFCNCRITYDKDTKVVSN
jgi:hypothetical protein